MSQDQLQPSQPSTVTMEHLPGLGKQPCYIKGLVERNGFNWVLPLDKALEVSLRRVHVGPWRDPQDPNPDSAFGTILAVGPPP